MTTREAFNQIRKQVEWAGWDDAVTFEQFEIIVQQIATGASEDLEAAIAAIVVEHRFIGSIVAGAQSDGLTVE